MSTAKKEFRRRGKFLGFSTAIVALTAALVFVLSASSFVGASNFEGADGNLVVNTAGNHDWDNAPNLSVGTDLERSQQDNSFGQGTKEDNVNVTVVAGSIPNSKADLARFASSTEVIGADTYQYLAWTRANQSGTVNFDFELNQAAQPDLTTPGPKVLNRTINDVLINYAFQGGSNTPTLTKRAWTGTVWGPATTIAGTCSEGATNSSPVNDTLGSPPNPVVSRPAQQFGEAAINLTCAGIVPPNACEPFASMYVKSRSSTSFTSEIKDFIAPISVRGSNCGKLTIIKHTNPGGLDQDFTYSTTGGLSPSTFTLNDDPSKVNTQVYTALQAGTYTVTEDPDPNGFAFASLNCVGAGGSVNGRTATAVIVGGSDITCTYINDQQLGAIKVIKASTKNGNPPLAGATFSVTGPGGFSTTLTSGADGTACVDGLVFGSYSVTETGAPAGYAINDSSAHPVTVDTNTTCGTGNEESLSFLDTPLTDIFIRADSQAVDGTLSQITCVDSSNANIGDSPSGNVGHPTVTATDLHPGTYTCTVVVDP